MHRHYLLGTISAIVEALIMTGQPPSAAWAEAKPLAVEIVNSCYEIALEQFPEPE